MIDLIPMTEPLLDQAATLLADAWSERHETGCRSVLGHVTTARHRVEGTLSIPAVAAVRDGNLVGFLGARPPRPPSQSVAMKAAMHATTRENRREIYRALYGQLTAIGGFAHTVAVNAKDLETVSAWFELGFGLDQVRGVQAVPQVPSNRAPQDVHVRLAADPDLDPMVELAVELTQFHAESPMLRPAPSDHEFVRDNFVRQMVDPRSLVVVVGPSSAPVGFLSLNPDPHFDDAVVIGIASVSAASSPNLVSDRFGRTRDSLLCSTSSAAGARTRQDQLHQVGDWYVLGQFQDARVVLQIGKNPFLVEN